MYVLIHTKQHFFLPHLRGSQNHNWVFGSSLPFYRVSYYIILRDYKTVATPPYSLFLHIWVWDLEALPIRAEMWFRFPLNSICPWLAVAQMMWWKWCWEVSGMLLPALLESCPDTLGTSLANLLEEDTPCGAERSAPSRGDLRLASCQSAWPQTRDASVNTSEHRGTTQLCPNPWPVVVRVK